MIIKIAYFIVYFIEMLISYIFFQSHRLPKEVRRADARDRHRSV